MADARAPFETLWEDTRRQVVPAEVSLPRSVDLAIVGGGILGLATALRTARAGRSVVVLEAQAIGRGASGLNGGQVIPGLKPDPDELIARFGRERGAALVQFAGGTADSVFDLVRDERLTVPHHRTGWIQAAHSEEALRSSEARARQWTARGAPVDRLDARDVARRTGASGYRGGLLDHRGGLIHPGAYCAELARIAREAGALVLPDSPVVAVRREAGAWQVATRTGASLRAARLLVATNAVAGRLVPGLARTILPLRSFQIATAPLEPGLAATILPGGEAVSDSRRIVTYYRKSPDGRLVLGGRGTLHEPRRASHWAHLEHAMVRLFPGLRGVPVTHRWSGQVAMTLDHLPHIHEPEPGLLAVLGCQGRGIALMTALGPPLADYLAAGDPALLPLPITPLRPIPLHRFRHLGVAAALAGYRLLDGWQR